MKLHNQSILLLNHFKKIVSIIPSFDIQCMVFFETFSNSFSHYVPLIYRFCHVYVRNYCKNSQDRCVCVCVRLLKLIVCFMEIVLDDRKTDKRLCCFFIDRGRLKL